MSDPAQNGAASAKAAKSGKARAPKLEGKLDRAVGFLNWALMGVTLFSWLSWLVFMAGTSALTAILKEDIIDEYYSTPAALVSFDWMLVWTSFVFLLLLTAACALGFGKRGRMWLLSSARGFLTFAVILVAWLGVAVHWMVQTVWQAEDQVDNTSVYSSDLEDWEDATGRARAMLAGEILLAIALVMLIILLLLLDRSHTSATLRSMIEDKTGGGPTNVQVNASGQAAQSTGAPSAYAGSTYGGAAPPQFPHAQQQPAQYQQPNQPPQPPQVPGYYAQ